MTSHTSVSGTDVLRDPQDFSLVLGGPLFQLLRRSHLSSDALELLQQRVLMITLLAWLPLLVIASLEGQALCGSAAVPFLLDVDVHVRFLVALPLLIVAELAVHRRMGFVVTQFLERHRYPDSLAPLQGGHPPARGRDTRAGCAAGTHHDAAGRTVETAVGHLVLGNLPERMHHHITLRL